MSVESSQSDADRQTCSPCRGTGKVISNLGGEQREVRCPWCEGTGEFKREHDAQEQAPSQPRAEAPAEKRPDAETGQ